MLPLPILDLQAPDKAAMMVVNTINKIGIGLLTDLKVRMTDYLAKKCFSGEKVKQNSSNVLLIFFKVTHLSVVPPVALMLAKHPDVDNFDLSYLTEVTCGAAPLGQELSKALMDRLPLLGSVRQGG